MIDSWAPDQDEHGAFQKVSEALVREDGRDAILAFGLRAAFRAAIFGATENIDESPSPFGAIFWRILVGWAEFSKPGFYENLGAEGPFRAEYSHEITEKRNLYTVAARASVRAAGDGILILHPSFSDLTYVNSSANHYRDILSAGAIASNDAAMQGAHDFELLSDLPADFVRHRSFLAKLLNPGPRDGGLPAGRLSPDSLMKRPLWTVRSLTEYSAARSRFTSSLNKFGEAGEAFSAWYFARESGLGDLTDYERHWAELSPDVWRGPVGPLLERLHEIKAGRGVPA